MYVKAVAGIENLYGCLIMVYPLPHLILRIVYTVKEAKTSTIRINVLLIRRID